MASAAEEIFEYTPETTSSAVAPVRGAAAPPTEGLETGGVPLDSAFAAAFSADRKSVV